MDNNELQVVPSESSFGNKASFEHAQRVANMLSTSSLVPDNFKNNIQNTMIALEMANRIGASPLMIMQNLYVIHGRPSWSSTFIIAAINSCGRFSSMQFVLSGKGETLECYAWATDKKTGDKLIGVTVTMAMAIAEGWVSKNGSKWKTMPELMIRYRAATFFGRLYAPDILMGMQTAEEIDDFTLMVTPEQEQRICDLLDSNECPYDEQRKRGIRFKIANGMSQGEAYKEITLLMENRVPQTLSATQITEIVAEHIEADEATAA